MKFRISSALKNHIGKELITDDNVAIFELVKNSYDADAKNVKIVFKDMKSDDSKIYIIDNGFGMSEKDLENKWLFLAFSEKKDTKINLKNKRLVAGSKGMGRFSCDRLGSKLKIYTKIRTDKNFNLLSLDWEKFEKDQYKEFKEINVNIKTNQDLIEDYGVIRYSGTIIEISDLRSNWDWKKMQKLKRYLQRLINPLQVPNEDKFDIELIAKDFIIDDTKQKYDYSKVNGIVENIIYEKLKFKTTTMECNISEDGKKIVTKLNDKGIDIFELEEKNNFEFLKGVKVKISYLNTQAKSIFSKDMGVSPKSYGNIFVFKNGFRVLPYGETEDDWLELNIRKSQGYKRYLGTRELLGRIEINDAENNFKEATSRNHGLLNTPSFLELKKFVLEVIIKKLEKYVVGAIYWDSENKPKDIASIKKDTLKIIKQIAGNLENKNLKYNENFLRIVERKTMEKIPETIKNIENIILKEKDKEKKDLWTQQVRSLKISLKLEKTKQKEEIEEKEEEVKEIKEELKKVETENIFIKSTNLQDRDQIISLFHHVGIHSDTIKTNAGNLFRSLNELKNIPEKSCSQIRSIAKISSIINTISKIGYRGGITEEMEKEKQDLIKFIEEFVTNICINYYSGIDIKIENNVKSKFIKEFIPFEFTYVVDNFISNSKKNHATEIKFNFFKEKDKIIFEIIDNGRGLNSKIKKIEEIFERNVSTTRGGAGLGLYDAHKIIKKVGGKISAENLPSGFKIRIVFSK